MQAGQKDIDQINQTRTLKQEIEGIKISEERLQKTFGDTIKRLSDAYTYDIKGEYEADYYTVWVLFNLFIKAAKGNPEIARATLARVTEATTEKFKELKELLEKKEEPTEEEQE